MANSVIQFRGHGLRVNDGPLGFWLVVLIDTCRKSSDCPRWLCDLCDVWRTRSLQPIGGCMHAHLDESLDTNEKVEYLIRMSNLSLQRINDKKNTIKGPPYIDIADMGIDPLPPYYEDFGAFYDYGLQIGESFIQLLQGKIDNDVWNPYRPWPDSLKEFVRNSESFRRWKGSESP